MKHSIQDTHFSIQHILAQHGHQLLIVAASLIALFFVAVSVHACDSNIPDQRKLALEAGDTYNWEHLELIDGRYHYLEDGADIARTGIDVSEHQGPIDWSAVSHDGIDFAFVRLGNRGATTGSLRIDDYALENLRGATKAGLDVGVYFFSQATNESEAIEEAEFALDLLAGHQIALPVVFDHEPVPGVEGRTEGLTDDQLTSIARAFCEKVSSAGYDTMIYGNARDLARYDTSALNTMGIWLAEYEVEKPSYSSGFSVWQYSNTGRVKGIDVDVDMNVMLLRHN